MNLIAKADADNRIKKYLLLIPLLSIFAALLLYPSPGATDDSDTDAATMRLIEALGCRGCHQIQGYGGSLAANLTDVGNRLTAAEIDAILSSHIATRSGNFMPAYSTLTAEEIEQLSSYLYHLR